MQIDGRYGVSLLLQKPDTPKNIARKPLWGGILVGNAHQLVEFLRVKVVLPIWAKTQMHPSALGNSRRQNESIIVVSVFAEQIYPSWSTSEAVRCYTKYLLKVLQRFLTKDI